MKAEPTRQWRLLDLAAVDQRIAQLNHRRTKAPQIAAADAAARDLAVVHDELVRAETALGDVEREVQHADDAVAQVRTRMERNQQRLDAGQGSPKDLQAIQHEIDSLVRRRGVLEDEQLEIMERAEELTAARDAVAEREREARDRVTVAEAERDAVIGEADDELQQARRDRESVLPGIGDDLLALYDKVGQQVGGIGAAALVARRCTGCNLELGPVDLDAIRAKAPDDVVRCEECRRILVRTAESGL